MEDKIFINKLPENFKVRTEIENDTFKIHIIENIKVWYGNLTYDTMKHFAEALGMSTVDYWKEVKTILTTHNGKPGYTYHIDKEHFVCRKEIKDTNMKSAIMKIKVQEKELTDTLDFIVDGVIEENMKLKSDLTKVALSHKQLSKSNDELLEKLQKHVKLKCDMEEDLYAKFLVLLNSKKEKIRALEKIIKRFDRSLLDNEVSDLQIDSTPSQTTPIETNEAVDDFIGIDSQHSVDEIECLAPKRKSTDMDWDSTRKYKALSRNSQNSSSTNASEVLDAENLLDEL